jgi:hypothetical protein
MNEIFDPDWQALFIRFLFNLVVVVIVARVFYYHKGKGKAELLFSFLSISALVFIICLILSRVPVEIGFALGLFAIFSIIRFRSIPLTVRELTYLFISIGLGVYNSLSDINTSIIRIIEGNLLILIVVGVAEWLLFRTGKATKVITYDRLDLLHEQQREALERDLEERFGIKDIVMIQSGDIDAIKNRVKLRVTFKDREGKNFEEI